MGNVGDLGPQALCRGGNRTHTLLVGVVGEKEQRADEEPDEGEERVGDEEEDSSHRQHHHDAEGHGERSCNEGRGLDVLVGVGEELACRVATMPFQRKAQVAVRHLDTIPILEPILRVVRASSPQGDAQAAQGRHSENRPGGSGQHRGDDLTGFNGRDQDRVGDPPEDV